MSFRVRIVDDKGQKLTFKDVAFPKEVINRPFVGESLRSLTKDHVIYTVQSVIFVDDQTVIYFVKEEQISHQRYLDITQLKPGNETKE